jgi:hypothetical protein
MPSGQHFILHGMVRGVRAPSRGWLYENASDFDRYGACLQIDLHRNAQVLDSGSLGKTFTAFS